LAFSWLSKSDGSGNSSADIAFLRNMRYDVTDLNEVKNIEPENVMQL
jgi:hypothetical protein